VDRTELDAQKYTETVFVYLEHLQYVQGRMPLTLSSDTLMANCMWEFMVIWNRDPEVTYALEQAVVYLRCVQNAALQHGIAYFQCHSVVAAVLSSVELNVV